MVLQAFHMRLVARVELHNGCTHVLQVTCAKGDTLTAVLLLGTSCQA